MSPIRASERARYPADWSATRARILRRAEGRCEFLCADGTRCDAPDLELIARWITNPERWGLALHADQFWPPESYRLVKVVLTIAHLDHEPEHCADDNLRAGCQLHHLRHDRQQHQANAARTRRAKKGNGELFA